MGTKRRQHSVLFLLLFPAFAGAQTVAVTGFVVDETRAAISGARLSLGAAPLQSDSTGAFQFQVPPGNYKLSAEKDGFAPFRTALTVTGSNLTLPPIVLKAASLNTTMTVSEDAGYQVPVVTSATKMPMETLDIPQSINAIPRQLLEQQVALSLNDALRNAPGVSPNLGEGRRDHMLIRGFSAVADQYIDGVRDDAQYYRDLSNVETVEVLKGPAAVLYGRGSSGGLINRITKKPDSESATGEVRVIASAQGTRRLEFDASSPFTSNKLAGRITGAYEDSGTFRDYFNLNRYAFAPSLLWKPTAATDVLAQFDYLNDERVPDRGIPQLGSGPAPVRLGAYYGYPQEDFIRTHAASEALTVNHRIKEDLTVRDVFRATTYDTGFSNTYPNGTSLLNGQFMVARAQYNGVVSQRNIFNQSEVTGQASVWGLMNQLLGGFEYGNQARNNTQFNGTATAVSLINPILTRPLYAPSPGTMNRFAGAVYGFYGQDLLTWKRFRLLAGIRRDRFEQNQISFLSGVTPLARVDNAWSPRVGLVYRLTQNSSLYATATKTFDPSGETLALAANNEQLKPEQTRNLEAGGKAELFDGHMSANLAVFRLDRTNIKTMDPNNPALLILVGRQRTDGVELNLAGHVWRGVEVTGGYAFMKPEITRSNSFTNGIANQGRTPALVPRYSGSLWATRFWKNGWGTGLGVFQAGHQFASNDNLVVLPGYVRVDAAVFYRKRHWGVSANLQNALNRRYYQTATTNSQIFPGSPVDGILALQYRW